jgi:cytochrome P450
VLARLRSSLERGEVELLRAVIDETMRRYAATPMIDRAAAWDVELGGVRIPRGSLVVVPILALHNHPRWFEEPAAFRPERYLDASPPRAFLPFSHGPRKCIGERLARVVVEAALARLVRDFDWGRPGGAAPGHTALINLRPRDHMRMWVERRVGTRARAAAI